MFGVNFQPGYGNGNDQQRESRPSGGSGVQEAIKILSLRLPKVVGAQAAAPMALLTSQGSGGNPRVDGVVNQVLSRMGVMKPGQPAAPVLGTPFGASDTMPFQAAQPWQMSNAAPVPYGKPTFKFSDIENWYNQPPTPPEPTGALSPQPVKDYWPETPFSPPQREDYSI